jgi:hypothetical protein
MPTENNIVKVKINDLQSIEEYKKEQRRHQINTFKKFSESLKMPRLRCKIYPDIKEISNKKQ